MSDLDEIFRWYEGNYKVPVMAAARVKSARAEIATLRSRVDTQAEIIAVWSPLIDKMADELTDLRAALRAERGET